MNTDISTTQLTSALQWKRPDMRLVAEIHRDAFMARCDALLAILQGQSIRHAAKNYKVNRNTLSLVAEKAFNVAPNGQCYGYRACLPWGVREARLVEAQVPATGRPHAMQSLLKIYPDIGVLLAGYKYPLPPGPIPSSFKQLLQSIRGLLAERGHKDSWPLNESDKGRRAFTRYVRRIRAQALVAGEPECTTLRQPHLRSLSQLVTLQPYDRFEFDAHSQDVKFTLLLPNARGELVKQRITKVWVLTLIDVNSTAVMAWTLVFGQGYSALDVAQCFAKSMRPWEPRVLLVPDMAYVPGATMPQNLGLGCMTSRMTAMDNAKAHKAKLPLEAWTDNYDGILNLGRAYVPEARAYIEQFFQRLEVGALRDLPGGFAPAKQLGENPTASSQWKGSDHPISIQALEDLLDVIMTGHNVSPLPSRQQRSPIEILMGYEASETFWPSPPHNENDARALTTQVRRMRLKGSRRLGKPVHMNLYGVSYRHPRIDKQWDLLNKEYSILIDLEDLRTIVMVDEALNEICTLEAACPWNVHRHDLTTRRRVLKLTRSGELEIRGSHSAISAYAAYTLASAQNGGAAVDQTARLLQLIGNGEIGVVSSIHLTTPTVRPLETPLTGRVSFDNVKDCA